MLVNTLQIRDRILSWKVLSMQSTDFIFKKYTWIYRKNDCIVTKALIMAISPGGGIMSDYFVVVVIEKSSQNKNL